MSTSKKTEMNQFDMIVTPCETGYILRWKHNGREVKRSVLQYNNNPDGSGMCLECGTSQSCLTLEECYYDAVNYGRGLLQDLRHFSKPAPNESKYPAPVATIEYQDIQLMPNGRARRLQKQFHSIGVTEYAIEEKENG